MLNRIAHIRERRRRLREAIDVDAAFEQWEETCVPSYCHRNPVAAYVSWLRLFAAADMAKPWLRGGARVLDFGSSVGELSHLLPTSVAYEFAELDDAPAEHLMRTKPDARRVGLEEVGTGIYDVIFAIDSLEHNDDFEALIQRLSTAVRKDGVLILSGPTENALYRLGRRMAGFDGHYHVTTIHDIERATSRSLRRRRLKTVPFGVPLFRISAWTPV